MQVFLGVIAFYGVASAIVEAAMKSLYRLYRGTRKFICRIKHVEYPKGNAIYEEWKPICRWLMSITSILLVAMVDISFINVLATNLLGMAEGLSGSWRVVDIIVSGLMVSRGSNFLHEFLENMKEKRLNKLM